MAPRFSSPSLSPLECDCRLLLRRNRVFQEQPSLPKLALRELRRALSHLSLYVRKRGGASEVRIHISGSAWWWCVCVCEGMGGGIRILHQALIDLWRYSETERVIVSFTLMQSNK